MVSVSPRTRRWRFVAGALLIVLLVWGVNRFYYNRYALTAPIRPTEHAAVAITRPYFAQITHVGRRIVWTRTASEQQPVGAPWHRDWLITITGITKNPWQLHPLTVQVYVNGQRGGIDGWFIPLLHPIAPASR